MKSEYEVTIRGFDYLKKITTENKEFIILITTYSRQCKTILQQLASMHISDKIYVGFPDNLRDECFQGELLIGDGGITGGIGKMGEERD